MQCREISESPKEENLLRVLMLHSELLFNSFAMSLYISCRNVKVVEMSKLDLSEPGSLESCSTFW